MKSFNLQALLARLSQCNNIDAIGICVYPQSPEAMKDLGILRPSEAHKVSRVDEGNGDVIETEKKGDGLVPIDIKLLAFSEDFTKTVEDVRDDIMNATQLVIDEPSAMDVYFDETPDASLLAYPIQDDDGKDYACIYVIAYACKIEDCQQAIKDAQAAIRQLE